MSNSTRPIQSPYNYYNFNGGGYYGKFVQRNPEFKTEEFEEFVISKNRGDRDSGELHNIAKHEVLRLAAEYAEKRWRFPNAYGDPVE